MSAQRMQIESFHDTVTGTVTHVVADAATGKAAVIDRETLKAVGQTVQEVVWKER